MSKQRNVQEFLPAVLEIQEKPPSPLGRVILWVLCVFAVLAILWGILGKVDIVAIGQGKIIPIGHVKIIQPLENGVIKTIHVENGQRVEAGETLIELDITQTLADQERIAQQLIVAKEKLEIVEKLYQEGASSHFDVLTQKEQVIALENELKKAEKRNALQTLNAPISGTVQELQIHTEGGVVTPAQELMKVVPFEAVLEAEVQLQNKDIGFIEEGQRVAVKLDAFPFTKYGMLNGTVNHVSHDAEQNQDLGLIFTARVRIDETHMLVGNKQVPVTPGMTISAEIKTGQRKLIEYFISPILKYQSETLRER